MTADSLTLPPSDDPPTESIPPSPPSICLSVIVGNEEEVIERFITAFAGCCQHMVFTIATGATPPDATESLITAACGAQKIPFTILHYRNSAQCAEYPHIDDFGAARQVGWMHFHHFLPDIEWVMWADADDTVDADFLAQIRYLMDERSDKVDLHILPYNVRVVAGKINQQVMRERIVHRRVNSHWNHAIHEQLAFTSDTRYRSSMTPAIIHSPLQSKRGGKTRNETILRGINESSGRNYFYLQQEAFEAGRRKETIALCKAGLAAIPELGLVERYEMHLNIAQSLGTEDCKEYAAKAFALQPDRREALALLTCYAITDSDPERALAMVKLMAATPRPRRMYWSQNNGWYGWRGNELMMQVMRLNSLDTYEYEREYRREGIEGFWEGRANDMTPTITISLLVDYTATPPPPPPHDLLSLRDGWYAAATTPEAVEVVFAIKGEIPETDRKFFAGMKLERDPLRIWWGIRMALKTTSTPDNAFPLEGWDSVIYERGKTSGCTSSTTTTFESLFPTPEDVALVYFLPIYTAPPDC
jgi:hypothetical protein